jgi:hypothetical protein
MACYILLWVLDWNRRHRKLMPKVQSVSLYVLLLIGLQHAPKES